MAEKSLFWTDAVGDGGPYNQAQLSELWEVLFQSNYAATAGVLYNYNSSLIVAGVATPVSVGSGAAVVKGHFYINTAAMNIAVPTPAVSTRIDRIILQADYTARTVRAVRLAGVEGSGIPPALTQVDGTTWEISLAQASITTGGVITVTDERYYSITAFRVNEYNLVSTAFDVAGAIHGGSATTIHAHVDGTTIEISGNALRVAASAAGVGLIGGGGSALAVNPDGASLEISGDALQVKALGILTAHIAAQNVTNAKIANGTIENGKLAASCHRMQGEIIMWSGTLSGHFPVDGGSPNTNWHICNGDTEGGVVTPNLADRFVVAQGSTYTKGDTAASPTHVHSAGSYVVALPTGYGDDSGVAHFPVPDGTYSVTGSSGNNTTVALPPYYCLIYLCYVGS